MIVFGLLLILIAAGAITFAVMAPSATTQSIELGALGITISASPLGMFVAGALSVVLVGLGFALITRGARRKASSRKELRELRKGQAETAPRTGTDKGRHSSSRDRSQSESDTRTTPDATTDHGATDPTTTDHGATDPATTDHGATDPTTTSPGATDPATTSTGARSSGAAADRAATPEGETTGGTSLDEGSRDTDKSANTDSTTDKGTDSTR